MEKTYVFGYGSLIWDRGVNGRGMKYLYKDSDLKEAKLKGYKRDWEALGLGSRWLGISKDKENSVIGCLLEIHSEDDLKAFKESENGDKTYYFVDVTKDIVPRVDGRVLTCVTKNPSKELKVPDYYIYGIKEGLKRRSKEFNDSFSFENAVDEDKKRMRV